ncbi:MAG: hypothetical protein IKU28_04125 [Erysipelotrichaceae bacterium]|nr:hypothetical protein [Erysipelotrichaceae bacterium]
MRYDTPVYFQKITPGEYDPSTGDYGDATVAEVRRNASVTDAGVETLNLLYSELKQGCKTVRLQTHYDAAFDRIRIGSKVYRADFERKLRAKHNFVVSEVQ